MKGDVSMSNNLTNFQGVNNGMNEMNEDTTIQQLTNVVGQIANMMGQNAMTTQNINKQLGIVSSSVNAMGERVNNLDERMYQIENHEEVTTEMCETIGVAAKSRIYEILGNDELERVKYYRTFIKRLWADAKRYGGCGHKIATTKKCNFQRVLDFIDAWSPSGGALKLKREIDRRAEAKRIAKVNGYY